MHMKMENGLPGQFPHICYNSYAIILNTGFLNIGAYGIKDRVHQTRVGGSIQGINRNMGKEGSTYQNVPSAWSAMRSKLTAAVR